MWLKVNRGEYHKIENAAEARGLSYREFVRRRLREALKEFLDDGEDLNRQNREALAAHAKAKE